MWGYQIYGDLWMGEWWHHCGFADGLWSHCSLINLEFAHGQLRLSRDEVMLKPTAADHLCQFWTKKFTQSVLWHKHATLTPKMSTGSEYELWLQHWNGVGIWFNGHPDQQLAKAVFKGTLQQQDQDAGQKIKHSLASVILKTKHDQRGGSDPLGTCHKPTSCCWVARPCSASWSSDKLTRAGV